LCFLYTAPTPTPWSEIGYWGSTLVVLLLTIFLVLRPRRHPGWLVGWLSFLILLGPLIGIFRTSEYVVADRYSYVPLQAAVILLAAGLFHLGERLLRCSRWHLLAGTLAAALAIGLCGVGSWRQSQTWHDSVTLRLHGSHYGAASSARANGALGSVLLANNRVEESVFYFEHAIELDPDLALFRKCLGVVRIRQKNPALAVPQLRQYLSMQPDDPEAHYLLGFALAHLGRLGDAQGCLADAARRKPDDPETQRMLGLVLWQLRRLPEAEAALRQSLRYRPDDTQTMSHLGSVLVQRGARQEGEQWRRKAGQAGEAYSASGPGSH
jgi:tetratricopeptide (TPR) repeat protein